MPREKPREHSLKMLHLQRKKKSFSAYNHAVLTSIGVSLISGQTKHHKVASFSQNKVKMRQFHPARKVTVLSNLANYFVLDVQLFCLWVIRFTDPVCFSSRRTFRWGDFSKFGLNCKSADESLIPFPITSYDLVAVAS